MENSLTKIYIKRDLEEQLNKYINDPEILAVMGPRQCGKTTLLIHIHKKLKNANFISFEDVKLLSLFENDIDSFITQHVKGHDFLFIDEFQYTEEGGKKLKHVYDSCKIKIFISGSSSTELSIKGLKYLTGRVLVFNLYPLSFKEFLRFKNNRLLDSIGAGAKLSKQIIEQVNNYLKDFIIYGGYPRVVLEENNEKKQKLLNNIYNIFMLKEIKEILGIKDRNKLEKLIKAVSLQISGLIVYNELSNITGYSNILLKEQINILKETFICYELNPHYSNKRTELVKSPKLFFIDNGLRNAVIDNFSIDRSDTGALYENFICGELVKCGFYPKFWRTKSGGEVDFVLENKNNLIPIGIKKNINKTIITQSFLSFIKSYKPKKGYFLSERFVGKRNYGKVVIEYFPLFYIFKVFLKLS